MLPVTTQIILSDISLMAKENPFFALNPTHPKPIYSNIFSNLFKNGIETFQRL